MNRARLFASACAGMFLFGVSLVLLGTLFGLPAMRERLELTSLVRQGDLQALLLVGVLISTVLVGPLIDRLGHKAVLTVSAALTAVALAGYAGATGYRMAQGLAIALGLGGGGLNMATNVLVSELYHKERGGKLNQLGVFFGVGALLMPFVTAWVERSITELMLGTAVLSAVAAVVYAYLEFPAAREASGASMLESVKALRYPGVLAFGFLLFFESGNEAAMTGWMTTWAGGVGASVRGATLLLAFYQGMMMLGRIVAAPILRRVSNSQMVVGSAASAVAAVVVLILAHSLASLAVAAALVGLAFAPIYPTVLALAGDRYQRYAGTVFGILFTIGLSGGIAYPWAIGHVSQWGGIRAGMWFPMGGTVAIAL
jgi:MFS transporter, FHS family, glucose/mannose:H+ symporter